MKDFTKQAIAITLFAIVLVMTCKLLDMDNEIAQVEEKLTYEDVLIERLEETVNEIQAEIEPESEEINYRETIRHACREWGIDEYLGISISRLETSNWNSYAFTKGFNYGGISRNGEPVMYADDYDGLYAYMLTLDAYRGMTVDEMASKYCPPNAKQWAKSVKQIIEEEKWNG